MLKRANQAKSGHILYPQCIISDPLARLSPRSLKDWIFRRHSCDGNGMINIHVSLDCKNLDRFGPAISEFSSTAFKYSFFFNWKHVFEFEGIRITMLFKSPWYICGSVGGVCSLKLWSCLFFSFTWQNKRFVELIYEINRTSGYHKAKSKKSRSSIS